MNKSINEEPEDDSEKDHGDKKRDNEDDKDSDFEMPKDQTVKAKKGKKGRKPKHDYD